MESVVIYARYSSEKQTEQSIEGQLRVCQEYAKKNNMQVEDLYIDRAMTGKNTQRAAFQKLIKDSEKRTFTAVLVYKLDRFARNRFDSAFNKRILSKNGVKVISATENISSNPEGILLESLLEGLAEYYSAELAQKVNRGIRESALKGNFLGGQPPYGYNIVNKKYVINEAEAKVVQYIYDLFLAGTTQKEILNILKQKGILNKKNKPFTYHQLYNILSKEIYIGTLNRCNIELENAVPSIITKEQHSNANLILSRGKLMNQKFSFLLSGKLFCGICGHNMTGTSGTSKNKTTYRYYECKHDKITLKQDVFEDFIYDELVKFIQNKQKRSFLLSKIDDYISSISKINSISLLEEKLKSVEKEISNLTKAILNGIINDNIKQENERLLHEKDLIIQQIHQTNNLEKIINRDSVDKFLCSFTCSKNEDDKKMLINILVNKIIYTKEKTTILLNLSPTTPNNPYNFESIEAVSGVLPQSPKVYHEAISRTQIDVININGTVYGLISIKNAAK